MNSGFGAKATFFVAIDSVPVPLLLYFAAHHDGEPPAAHAFGPGLIGGLAPMAPFREVGDYETIMTDDYQYLIAFMA